MIKKMMYMIFFSFVSSQIGNISVDDIINKMDKNLNAKSRVLKSKDEKHKYDFSFITYNKRN